MSLQQPRAGMWAIAANEPELLEEWVRTVAIPVLVTDRHDVSPLPPHLDITVGHRDIRTALAAADRAPTVVWSWVRIAAVTGRAGLVECWSCCETAEALLRTGFTLRGLDRGRRKIQAWAEDDWFCAGG
ncbi:hypothetical protein [Streptomyces sp. NRRL WC-3549]|uniref:hypothetical protein n=1 Tax=Streptomyces sp. NRRL WC-3549 TaxID=1463925 RepID=UPI001F26AEF4|nr:hypothetical protein [Streptomyces sp. NRRL WC-3549]